MSRSATLTLNDPDHIVTYSDAGGVVRTETRNEPITVFAPDAPGSYPVIVYSHGHFGGPALGAGANAAALADQGYIVIVPTHLDSTEYPAYLRNQFPVQNAASTLHRIADLQFALDMAPTIAAALPGAYSPELDKIAVAGHSHGAFSAALLAGLQSDLPGLSVQPGNPYGVASLIDPRVDATLLFSPQGADSTWANLSPSSWDDLRTPVLVLTGSEDSEPGDGAGWEARLDVMRYADAGPIYSVIYEGATHNDLGGRTASAALLASEARIADTFLDGYLSGDANARLRLADVQAIVGGEPLLRGAFSRPEDSSASEGYVRGLPGGDTLFGLQTSDVLHGADGPDQLQGAAGADLLEGGAGNDALDGGAGDDALVGGFGDDTYVVDSVGDTIVESPGGGADTVQTSLSLFVLGATAGSTNVENVISTGGGAFTGYGDGAANAITGGVGADVIVSLGGDDVVTLGAGNDYVYAGDGNDTVYGDDGNDVLLGEAGTDTLNGGAGSDYLYGLGDNDTLNGDAGVDILIAGDGNDTLNGGTEQDYLYGEGGDDTANGGDGDDIFILDDGNDTANGDAGNDYFYGGNGNDTLSGGDGVDVMLGEAGDDVITTGAGVDYAFLGTGNDTFVMDGAIAGTNVDVLYDFTPGAASGDVIRLVNTSFSTLAQVQAAMIDTGNGYSILVIDPDTQIWIIGVVASQLAAGDVVFF